MKFTGQITGSGGLTINGGSGNNNPASAPYLLVLNGLANNYTGNTTINNATVTNDAGIATAMNILPVTTVLTLTHSAVFAYYNGNSTQTLAGLAGDSSTAIGTENNISPVSLTLNPAAGKSYTYAGTIGPLDVLGRGNGGLNGAPMTLTIGGPGTQVLSGANDYKGGTIINAGTLVAANGSNGSALGQRHGRCDRQ